MRLLTFLLVVVAAVVLTSCLTIEEKITLNKDGSGTYQTFVDMGEMLSNPLLSGAMQEEMAKNGGDASAMRMDSTIDLYTELSAKNPQWTNEERNLIRKVNSRMSMDFEKMEGGVYVNYDFSSMEELMQIQDLMSSSNADTDNEDEAAEGNPLAGMMGGSGPVSGMTSKFSWKKGLFTRTATIPAEFMKGMGLDESDETMGMVKMMMADAKISYVVEFPGAVKKVKGFTGHSIDGNRMTQEFGFLELLEKPAIVDEALDGSVKFKK